MRSNTPRITLPKSAGRRSVGPYYTTTMLSDGSRSAVPYTTTMLSDGRKSAVPYTTVLLSDVKSAE